MEITEDESKLAQFEEFFSIDYEFQINATLLPSSELLNFDEFIHNMPTLFKITSEISFIDQQALRPLQAVSGVAGQLLEYLKHQEKKIDLLLGFVIEQQNESQHRFQGISFGGGGITFKAQDTDVFKLGDFLTLKLFFSEENAAVYCIGEIIGIESRDESYVYNVIFHHIREEDLELIVRTTLHQQSKQLQARAQQRNHKQLNE